MAGRVKEVGTQAIVSRWQLLYLAANLECGVYFIWAGAVRVDAEVFARGCEIRRAIWRGRRAGSAGGTRAADRGRNRVLHRRRAIHRCLGVLPLVRGTVFRTGPRGRVARSTQNE